MTKEEIEEKEKALKGFEMKLAEREATVGSRETAVGSRETKVDKAELEHEKVVFELTQKNIDQRLVAWQKLIDMASHFNELCLSVRRFALAALATSLAATAAAYRFGGSISFSHPEGAGNILPIVITVLLVPLALAIVVRGGPANDEISAGAERARRPTKWLLRLIAFIVLVLLMGTCSYVLFAEPLKSVHVATLFVGIAAVVWILCYLIDRFWYHELLRGAVAVAQRAERLLEQANHKSSLGRSGDRVLGGLSVDVTSTIRAYSHASLNLHAGAKLSIFYLTIYLILVGALALLFLMPVRPTGSSADDIRRPLGSFEAYPLERLPPFAQGSVQLTTSMEEAICAARAALHSMRVGSVVVVARHDQAELKPASKQSYGSNSALARARAEAIADALRGSLSCPSPRVEQVMALDSAPLHVGRNTQSTDMAEDRRGELFGLRLVSILESRTDTIR